MGKKDWMIALPSGRPARLYRLLRQTLEERGWDIKGILYKEYTFRCVSTFNESEHWLGMAFMVTQEGDQVVIKMNASPALIAMSMEWPDSLKSDAPDAYELIIGLMKAFAKEIKQKALQL